MKMKKSFAVLLALLMLLQAAAVGATADTPDKVSEYTGTVLAAINTDYDDVTRTFSAYLAGSSRAEDGSSQVNAPQGHTVSEEGLLCGEDDALPEPLSAAEAAEKQAALGADAAQAAVTEYHVGDFKTIKSSYRKELGSEPVTVECVYVGEYCTVWNEVDGRYSVSDSVTLGKNFDEMVVREFEMFGDKRIDTDGDGKTALFVYELDSSYGGYFSVSDLVDSHGRIGNVWFRYKGNGNACDCVHLDGPYLSTVAHEFQHYLQRCWQFYGKNNLTYVPNKLESYINEGFSECASYLLLGTNSRVWWFEDVIADPTNYSLVNWSFDSAAYAASYVFCQYLRTSYAQLPGVENGAEIYKIIMETRANKLVRNTLSIAADLLYPKSLYPNLKTSDSRCRQLIVDFWMAVLCKEDEGRWGFMGETWADPIEAWVQESLPEDGSIGIRSAMAAFYYTYDSTPEGITEGTARVTKAGKDLVFVSVSDIGYKVRYDWNNGLWEPESFLRVSNDETTLSPSRRCPGKTFLGWSTNPDATSAGYSGGVRITLTKGRETVLYAVWENASTLQLGRTVNVYDFYRERCFRFTPEQTGWYSLRIAYGVKASLCLDGEALPVELTEWFGDDPGRKPGYIENSVYLEAGTPYDVYGIRTNYLGSTISIYYVSQPHTLRYDANLDSVSEPLLELSCRSDYTVSDIDADTCDLAMTKGLEFIGWAADPAAAEAQYKPDEKLTPEADTTLYAVWQPMAKLTVNSPATLDYAPSMAGRMFSVTPEGDGTYKLSVSLPEGVGTSESLYVYNGEGKLLLEKDMSADSIELSLRGGRTYFFMAYFYAARSEDFTAEFSLQKISDKSSAQLIFNLSETGLKKPLLIMSDRFVYTVPRLDPVMSGAGAFLGWRGFFSAEEYSAGKEVELIVSSVLSPEWEDAPDTAQALQFLSFVARSLRFYLQLAALSLKGNVTRV